MIESNGSSNFVTANCLFKWTNPEVQESTIAFYDTILWSFSLLSWTVGLAMMVGILHYERFGGDPQKRGLGNRLISCGIISQLGQCICLQLLLVLIRLNVGSYNVYMILLSLYLQSCQNW